MDVVPIVCRNFVFERGPVGQRKEEGCSDEVKRFDAHETLRELMNSRSSLLVKTRPNKHSITALFERGDQTIIKHKFL